MSPLYFNLNTVNYGKESKRLKHNYRLLSQYVTSN